MFAFAEKLYVGFKDKLAFAVPDDNEKRKITVDGWRSKEIPIQLIENLPTSGFKLGGLNTRYRTSREWIEVDDPRGFTLEISVSNFLNICEDNRVENGFIVGDYVWLHAKGGKVYLANVESREYDFAMKPYIKPSEIEIGKFYITTDGNIVRYDGRFDFEVYTNLHLGTDKPFHRAVKIWKDTIRGEHKFTELSYDTFVTYKSVPKIKERSGEYSIDDTRPKSAYSSGWNSLLYKNPGSISPEELIKFFVERITWGSISDYHVIDAQLFLKNSYGYDYLFDFSQVLTPDEVRSGAAVITHKE